MELTPKLELRTVCLQIRCATNCAMPAYWPAKRGRCLSNVEMTKAADFLLSREVCLVQPSEEVLYVLLYTHLDHLHSILECEFDIRRSEQTLGHLNSPPICGLVLNQSHRCAAVF